MDIPDLNCRGNEEFGSSNAHSEEEMNITQEPTHGMEFDTIEEAYDFYNTYARRIGFSIRIRRTNKNKSDKTIIQRRLFVCSCEGVYEKKETPSKKRDNQRFDCKALLKVNRGKDGKYKVMEFKSEHSHDLVPVEHSQYLKSQRKINFEQAQLMKQMHSSGLKQGQIFSYLSEEAGGVQNMNFTRSDCNNYIQKQRSEFLKKGDSNN